MSHRVEQKKTNERARKKEKEANEKKAKRM